MKMHHTGIACKDIEQQLLKIKEAHDISDISEIVQDDLQNARLCMVTLEDGSRLELVSGPAVEVYVKKNISFYHVCYEVNNLQDKIDELVAKNWFLVSPPKEAILFDNRKVAFLMGPYGLVELLDSKK